MSPKAEGGFVEGPWDFYKSSRGLRGHLITNFPNFMVLVCNTMIDEEIWLALFRILLGSLCLLMHVNEGKLEICPVWKLKIKFPVRTNETEAIMVLLRVQLNIENPTFHFAYAVTMLTRGYQGCTNLNDIPCARPNQLRQCPPYQRSKVPVHRHRTSKLSHNPWSIREQTKNYIQNGA